MTKERFWWIYFLLLEKFLSRHNYTVTLIERSGEELIAPQLKERLCCPITKDVSSILINMLQMITGSLQMITGSRVGDEKASEGQRR